MEEEKEDGKEKKMEEEKVDRRKCNKSSNSQ